MAVLGGVRAASDLLVDSVNTERNGKCFPSCTGHGVNFSVLLLLFLLLLLLLTMMMVLLLLLLNVPETHSVYPGDESAWTTARAVTVR